MKQLARGSGIFSLFGGTAIIMDNMGHGKDVKNVYNWILVLMAAFDILNSSMWIVGDIATPKHDPYHSNIEFVGLERKLDVSVPVVASTVFDGSSSDCEEDIVPAPQKGMQISSSDATLGSTAVDVPSLDAEELKD